jgi:outer membrane protein assembly factor BamD
MIESRHLRRTSGIAIAVILAAFFLAGCASTARNSVPAGTLEPDRYLFDKGTDALKEHKWLTAREYMREVFETYTQSPYRPDAKLGIGDTYMGEGGSANMIQAIAEYTEFLTFFPTNPRADYAQYQLALAYFRQMRGPQRDQKETNDAVREFETFVTRYPNSSLMPDAQSHLREARDRLDDHEFEVGFFYYRINWWPGAIDRFKSLLADDPKYTHRDDVYFYLGETLLKQAEAQPDGGKAFKAEALPYYARLVDEFQQSEHLEDARKRIAELTPQSGDTP